MEADEAVLEALRDLLREALRAKGVLVASATKVLHRKRPRLVPMLDSVVLGHYLSGPERRHLLVRPLEKASPDSAAEAAMVAIKGVKEDLAATADSLSALQDSLAQAGLHLSLVRILDILVWTETEPRGAYRGGPNVEAPR